MTNDLHHLAAAYSLDALTTEERRDFEAHYPACSICAADVEDYRATATHLAAAVAHQPSPDIKAKVMAQIAETDQLPPIVPERVVALTDRRRSRSTMLLTAVAAAVIAIVGVFSGMQFLQGPSDVEELLALPDAVVADLDGDVGMVRIVWSAQSDQIAVIAADLPDPGDGMVYELWFLLDDGVAPAGLFNPSNGMIREVVDVADRTPVGWGVTIEPAGGSDMPTGAILYAGTF